MDNQQQQQQKELTTNEIITSIDNKRPKSIHSKQSINNRENTSGESSPESDAEDEFAEGLGENEGLGETIKINGNGKQEKYSYAQ